jgi:hypothetical protein
VKKLCVYPSDGTGLNIELPLVWKYVTTIMAGECHNIHTESDNVHNHKLPPVMCTRLNVDDSDFELLMQYTQ